MCTEFDEYDELDEVICSDLDDLYVNAGVMDCEAYYGEVSHITIDNCQPQPLDASLFTPADLLDVFRKVRVTHMTTSIERAIEIMNDVSMVMRDDLLAGVNSVVCGRCGLVFPQIDFEDIVHYIESVE